MIYPTPTLLIQPVEFDSPAYHTCKVLRSQILRAPLGLTLSSADLAGEEQQYHFAAIQQQRIVGTVILKPLQPSRFVSASFYEPMSSAEITPTPGSPTPEPGCAKLRQMAVLPERQGQGIGRALVQFAEQAMAQRGFGKIELAARVPAVGFYETLGYQKDGDIFLEVGIPHINMYKSID